MGSPSPDRWRQIEEILVSSWELPASDREAYWAARAAGDSQLLVELRQLSAARDAADHWSAPTPTPSPEPPPQSTEHRIGPYLIDRLIGRGGMGAVYLAHRADGEFEQQLALKVIGLPFEIEPFRERFRRERQILAGLSHLAIAHLLDGGTTEDGQLYLAMEYVDGVAIDAYAKGLDLAARLELFRQVCDGVQYAHQNLVVHRDIKPSNILVNSDGVPKLLDFGAAKLLDDAEAQAGGAPTRSAMMTIAYASPEQLRGEAASTLSDVFSLGALLYELVTGEPAFGGDLVSRVAGFTLAKSLPGDLDRVVRKALAFEPAQRYPSVEQFSEDVRRYLANEPVSAHPPGLAYRAGKFLRRHAVGAGLAAMFVLGLAGATAFSIRQAGLAQREAARAQAANRFLTTVFRTPFYDTGSHHDMTVRELLELAEKRVDSQLGWDPAIAADADFVLADGLEAQQANPEAGALYQRALARARQSGDIARQSIAISRLALVAYASNQPGEAWGRAIESLRLWKSSRQSFTPEQAVAVLTQSGQMLQFVRPSDPLNREYLEEAARLARQHSAQLMPLQRALAFQCLAESYLSSPGRGEQAYRQAYPLIQEAVELSRSDPSLDGGLVSSLRSWGRVNRFLGDFAQDEAAQREVYQLLSKHLGPDNAATASQRAIWSISLSGVGKAEEAYRESQAALATMRRQYPVPGSTQLWTNTAAAAWGACLTSHFQQCEALAREALQTLEPNPQPDDLRLFEARSYLGLALTGEGRYSEALPLLRQTVEFYHSRNRKGLVLGKLEDAYARAQAQLTPAHPHP